MSLVSGPGRGGARDSGALVDQTAVELCPVKHVKYVQELDKVLGVLNRNSTTLMAKRGKMNMSTG